MANQITAFLDTTKMPSQSQAQATFDQNMAAFFASLPTFGAQLNAGIAAFNAAAAGSAYAIPYTVDLSSTADLDPGNGTLRFDSATQSAATTLRLDLLNNLGGNVAAILDTFDASTSVVKGTIRLVKMGDATAFLMYSVTARTAPTGYRDITVTPGPFSANNPFIQGDAVLLHFTRTGDMGTTGTIARRVTSGVNVTAPTPNIAGTDLYVITGLAGACTLGVPIGTPLDGQSLMYRIKDNGTAQTLAYNAIYRAPVELAFPSATVVGKWTYLGFIYNATDSKWDMVAAISNM